MKSKMYQNKNQSVLFTQDGGTQLNISVQGFGADAQAINRGGIPPGIEGAQKDADVPIGGGHLFSQWKPTTETYKAPKDWNPGENWKFWKGW